MRASCSGRELGVALLLALADAGEVTAREHVPVGDAGEGENAEHAVGAGSPRREVAGALVHSEQLVAGDGVRAGVLPVLRAAVELHVPADVDLAADHGDRLDVAVRAAEPLLG